MKLILIFFSLGVFFFSGALLFLFETDEPSNIYAAISALFYLCSGVLLALKKKEAMHFVFSSKFPILICILAFASILWSYNPSLALTRSIALLGTLFFALSMIVYLDFQQIVKVLVYPLFFSAILAIIFALFIPSIGIDDGSNVADHYGLWHGTFGFKNTLGRVMGLLAIILLAQQVIPKNKTNMMLALTLLVLVMSGSSTPIISVLFILILKMYLSISHRITNHLKIIMLLITLYLSFLTPLAIEFIVVDVMGKDFTGSGRMDMWADILLSIDSPILGYGFGGGFWGEFGYANGLIDSRYILLGHAHNGFVDTLIELGLFGVVFYFLLLLRTLIDSTIATKKHGSYFLLPLFLAIFFIIYSISGSAYIKQNNILFVLACLASFLPYKKDFVE